MPLPPHPLVVPLLLTLSVQGLIAIAMVALPVLLPAYARELSVGAAFAGTSTACVYGGATLTALLVSPRVRGIGAVRMCQMALVCVGAGLCLAVSDGRAALVAGALAVGLGYGPVTAASALLLARTAPPGSLGLVFSINRVSIPLGAALAGALLPTLSVQAGWRMSLLAFGLLCAACAAVLQLARGLDAQDAVAPATPVPHPLRALAKLVAHPKRRVLTQASLAFLAAQACLASFTVTFLVDQLAMSYVRAGAVLAMAQMAGVVARLVMGFVSDRSRRRTLVIGLMGLVIALATGLAAAADTRWSEQAVLLVFLLYGAGALGWNGVLLAEMVQTASPGEAGEIAGASSAIAFGGAFAGPAIFSGLLAVTGYAAAFGLLSLAVLACSLATLRFEQRSAVSAPSRP